ncbi:MULTISPECIES: MoaD/ThiS family protein [Pseudomonas]|uniref:Molybdopterin synthase sulfur carrier subunit n=1 Tax=Pseudomonas piscis TaxID=2614538 RepID=A0A7X1PHU3_9PSED|nr:MULTISPECIES: MoaD/ThiS family protein [Pseudomonas]MBC2656771.1 MoaD/ThiS family protein [Pseudomonas sp. MSSRFD41]MCU7649286.1 MoaD/ThiS family protein [Pseudomonas piscis]MQA52400.1 molybdopterin synthase sulfur carrier subunit [Pseudomonas piscis]
MKIKVKFFARYREAIGLDETQVDGEFRTVEDVRQHLLQGVGAPVLGEQNLMCARNEELCQLAEPLADGDEVAFFPTVTGG